MISVVVPTVGRPCLLTLLQALAAQPPDELIVVDDRRDRSQPLPVEHAGEVEVVAGPGGGPAAARNVGWEASDAEWVVFVDDDVVPTEGWLGDLDADLRRARPDVVGVQGRVTVPLPTDRRPTDWERNVAGLETARWITADMAVRRRALAAVGGFDERFPRAYREDAELALRLQAQGGTLVVGRRRVLHPVRPAPWWVSLRLQAGNRDDVLIVALHGRKWQGDATPKGRRGRHVVTTVAGLTGLTGLGLRRPAVAAAGLGGWLAGTAELAWARIAPGPRTPAEVGAMVATSLALPPLASWHWLAGLVGRGRLLRAPGPAPRPGDRGGG